MVVIVLTDCPAKLRGDLSKWFFEINTGVYVGNVSSRVRTYIWERICENIAHGQATMVFSSSGEQKMDFYVHNTVWKVVDYDGLKLMQRPNSEKKQVHSELLLKKGFSKAAVFRRVESIQRNTTKNVEIFSRYVVINFSAKEKGVVTGHLHDFAYLQIENNNVVGKDYIVFDKVDSIEIKIFLQRFLNILADCSIVCSNAVFQINTLCLVLKKHDLKLGKNKVDDIQILSKRKKRNYLSVKLDDFPKLLNTSNCDDMYRNVWTIFQVYKKLNEI